MTKLNQLVEVLKNGKRLFIQMHNSPDPDALASAYGLQYLLAQKGLNADICYKGFIDKYNTQRMIELLEIQAINILELKDLGESDTIVLVDSQKGNSNIIDLIGNEVATIDHHPIFKEMPYLFSDIRPEMGACSTIIAGYFIENNIQIPMLIATALMYGIKMDTHDLSRGVSHTDLDMFCMLYKQADIGIVNKIQINTLQFEELIAYSNAIKNIKVYNNIGFSNAGFDCPDSLLGTISDFLLSLKEVVFTVIYSSREDGMKFSIRNETDYLDAGKIINLALEGYGNGGGHKSMAGGFVTREQLGKIDGKKGDFFDERFQEVIHSFNSK